MKRAAVGSKFWSNGDQSKEVTVTSRRLHVVTLQRRDVNSRSAPYHLKYEWLRNQGIERRTNEGTEFQSIVTQTSRKCPGFVLSFIVWLFSDIRMVFLILNIFFFSFIMF